MKTYRTRRAINWPDATRYTFTDRECACSHTQYHHRPECGYTSDGERCECRHFTKGGE